jgi:hypothetical protein
MALPRQAGSSTAHQVHSRDPQMPQVTSVS